MRLRLTAYLKNYDSMLYGLDKKEIAMIRGVFADFNDVEKVFIHGSRARGDYKKTSDIDLAVRFAADKRNSMAAIRSELDDLSLIYEIDAIDEAEIRAGKFRDEYENTKKVFYKKSPAPQA